MANFIEAYKPDLDLIAEYSKDFTPFIITDEEYAEVLAKHNLRRGELSDKGITRAMEAGLIKVRDPEKPFDLLKQLQAASVDVSMGHHFWFFRDHLISKLTFGTHVEEIETRRLLEYAYKLMGEEFVFHRGNGLVLPMSQEQFSLSNVIAASFDGRSSLARLGASFHQTAGGIAPGFRGAIQMEVSNTGKYDIGIRVGDCVGSMSFRLLAEPSTRPRTQKTDSQSFADNQISPFGYWDPRWDGEKEEAVAKTGISGNSSHNGKIPARTLARP